MTKPNQTAEEQARLAREENEKEAYFLASRRMEGTGIVWLNGNNTPQEVVALYKASLAHFSHAHFAKGVIKHVEIGEDEQHLVLHTVDGHKVRIRHDSQDYDSEAANNIKVVAQSMTKLPPDVHTIILKKDNTDLQNENFRKIAALMGLTVLDANGKPLPAMELSPKDKNILNAEFVDLPTNEKLASPKPSPATPPIKALLDAKREEHTNEVRALLEGIADTKKAAETGSGAIERVAKTGRDLERLHQESKQPPIEVEVLGSQKQVAPPAKLEKLIKGPDGVYRPAGNTLERVFVAGDKNGNVSEKRVFMNAPAIEAASEPKPDPKLLGNGGQKLLGPGPQPS